MRSVRLLGIIMELSRVHSTSISVLAERFEVSERTVQRDVNAIADLGVPVWTRPGPAGGVGIVEGWRSPIIGMTGPEIQALMIGAAGSDDLGMADAFGTARLKILTASAVHHHAQSVDERFLNDNAQWFSIAERPEFLATIAEAVWASRRLTMQYARHGAPPKQRLVDPLGLVLKTDRWYLVASHRQKPLTYLVSRILSAKLHAEPARRPDGFSLTEYWRASSSAFESSLHTLKVHLSIPQHSVTALLVHVPGPATRTAVETARLEGQQLYLDLLMENIEIAATQLIAVPGVEVTRPTELRRKLRIQAQNIAKLNGSPAPSDEI